MSTHTTPTAGMRWGPGVDRPVLTPQGLAARLEHRLHLPEVDQDGVRRGCAYAIDAGMPTVLCRPEHVEVAAQATADTPVEVATALAVHEALGGARPAESYAEEADARLRSGASQVGLIASAEDLTPAGLDGLTARIAAVREAVDPFGGKVRVMVRTMGMTMPELRLVCQEVAQAGVWLVQGGTYLGDRVGLNEIVEMREALGPDVLLKWTNPLRSVEAILVCLAEGVDRFNGDPPKLLKAARHACRYEPLEIPIPGVDY